MGLAESTCSAVFPRGNASILNIVDLGEIALERSSSAREAVGVMGLMAETYGYDDEGESLFVGDVNEVLVNVACCVSRVTRHASHVTRHTSHVTHHTSHITHHTSHITHHTSHITSPLTQVWIFHILPDDTGSSAIWAAARVPDSHVSVVANAFVIREVNVSDSSNFLASGNMLQVAKR